MFTEAYLGPNWTCAMELFAIADDLQLLTIFAKSSLVDVWLGSKYASGSLDTPILRSGVMQVVFINKCKSYEINNQMFSM